VAEELGETKRVKPQAATCWRGPYKVIKKLSDLTYLIQKGKERSFPVHAELLHRHVQCEDCDKREGTANTEKRSMPTQEGAELETGPTGITVVDSSDMVPEETPRQNDEDHVPDSGENVEDHVPDSGRNVEEDQMLRPNDQVQEQGTVRRSTRHRVPPDRYGF